MKGTSKVIMGATLVMAITLIIVMGLVLVLIAELYCSLLFRRRQLRTAAATASATSAHPSQSLNQSAAAAPPLGSFYAQGVLNAPRNFLFPSVSTKDDQKAELKRQHSQILQILEAQTQESTTAPYRVGLVSSPIQQVPVLQGSASSRSSTAGCDDVNGARSTGEHFVCISNPIYDNIAGQPSREGTPFETPDTSPSRLEMGVSSGEDKSGQRSLASPSSELITTPPLTPMKKLPADGCSVSLRDARSLDTSGSDSNSNNGLSSSSSGTPGTSPSW
ncbi:uncharacterized protein LOC131157946 [Malania oleifera]|uniref:uncharacterized protein LOC131157946 n=1 Tax=Malania oleifera TaxID=397392 RepID=UPI0025ADA8BA|nr:uncharacterized protein LOC131157946 [Malania oleifera]